MEHSKLYNMIKYLEKGTNLHIGVLFFKNYGCSACELPNNQQIHYSPMCDKFKVYKKSAFSRCFKCRNLAIKKALESGKAFDGLCINGIYEYTHPVLINGEVAFMIFIGNILDGERSLAKIKKRIGKKSFPIDTMEKDFPKKDCQNIGALLEEYILYLLERYPDNKGEENALIKNIKTYINCNLEFDINITNIAKTFHYNPRYLGRLFKKETGIHMYEYITNERIERAKKLLKNTSHSVINISNEVGFNNVTYFNQLFKRHLSVTPKQYRDEK